MSQWLALSLLATISLLTSCDKPSPDPLPDGVASAFYVATDGNDANPGNRSRPFATLERARTAVREIRNQTDGDILVSVAPGDYFLDGTFVLNAQDSGRSGGKNIYRGEGAAGSARLIGGEPIVGWQPAGKGIYKAEIRDGQVFHTLYENGVRARKARFPNYESNARFPLSEATYLKSVDGSDTELIWREGDLESIYRSIPGDDANLVFWPWGYADWQKVTRRISAVNPATRSITVPENKGNVSIGRQARYYIEGVRAFLDEPGEFYLDRVKGILYYWPRFGDPDAQEIIAPHLLRLISLEGESTNLPVRDVVIEGLGMAFTDTFEAMTGPTLFPWSPSTEYGAHGTLHLRYTEDVEILFNHIQGSGLSAIYLDRSNKHDRIYGNWIEDAGLSGIVLAYHRQAKEFPEDINEGNLIENNLIHRLGAIGVDSAGVNIWGARDNTIRHCEIFDGARYGVTIRGNFAQIARGSGADMSDTNRHITGGNRVEFSHFYRLGQDSGDMGAIHMAGISSLKIHPVNYLENLLIEDIKADPSMKDIAPNGVFFDYPQGVTDQVLRNIDIRSTPQPFRTNNTDIRHIVENCSWLSDFDPSRIEHEKIGLKDDFPEHFGPPPEVADVTVATSDSDAKLQVAWKEAADSDIAKVWITVEGEPEALPISVLAGVAHASVPKPEADRIVRYRLQTEGPFGNRSQGILVRAGVNPGTVENLRVTGVPGGIEAAWSPPPGNAKGYRITVDDPTIAPIEAAPGVTEVRMEGLVDHRVYTLRVEALGADGHPWPGAAAKIAAGEGAAVPQDPLAWWTFDEPEVYGGLSIGDTSGNGNTLFVGNDQVELSEGHFGKALRFDGESAYARVLGPQVLAIGAGDYAISAWIRQAQTNNFTERFIDFGGTEARPGICLMANNTDVRVLFHDGKNGFSVYYRGLDMVDNWMHVVVNVVRDGELSIYVNGEKIVSEDISAGAGIDIPAAENFFVGRYASSDSRYYWPGDIDQLRVFNRALTPAEISALFQEL